MSEVVETTPKAEEAKSAVEVLEAGSTVKETETFVYMDNVKKVLDISMATGRNSILYGPGGYGKSEYTLAYMREKGIEPYVITMGSGMTTDRLFGGLDIPTFNATGKIEYLVDNSFMNHEYVIFEELFDAPDFILEQLKDILSSGVFRNGTQIYPIKTRTIICCTNKTREEFSKNNSLRALMERFPIEVNVVWKDYTRHNYEHLFKTKLGGSDPMLTYILEQYAVAGVKISPRIAIVAAMTMAECGPDALTFIAEFASKPEILKTAAAKFDSILEVAKITQALDELVSRVKGKKLDSADNLAEAEKVSKEIEKEIKKLQKIKADDTIVAQTTEAIKNYTDFHTKLAKRIEVIKSVDNFDDI